MTLPTSNPHHPASTPIVTPTTHPHLLIRSGFGKICAFENGNPQLPLGCLPGYDCTHDGAASVSGCCATAAAAGKCMLETTPAEGAYLVYLRLNACTGERTDASSDEAEPYCTTAYFVDGYAMFTCGAGEGRAQVSAFYHMSSSSIGRQQQPYASSGVASEQPDAVDSDGGSTSKSSSSAPIGAIVGGVVGGAAVLLITISLVWFVLQKRRKDRSATAARSGSSGSPNSLDTADQVQHVVYEKQGLGYSEMAARPAEMFDGRARYAHEAPLVPADPTSVGRSELPAERDSRYELI
ncbi:uncharacterized protein LTR77_011177 [Saxophila tyrrhenica]|uniref:Uncharacterized protein n=1 Tax=Saxophila tyrrhenica TaxID=1690608 RepID=A0AAV9NUZ9_9PEZI|nr:hypothetical protein LTR77_011177 [Saxophila tyrrhenica]